MNTTGEGYKAWLYDPSLGSSVVEGTIHIDQWKVRFQSPELTEEIPVDRVKVESEEDGDRISFKDVNRPELKIFTLDESILEDRALAPGEQLRAELITAATRREISRRLRLIVYVLIGCALLTWFASLAVSAMVRSLVARVPPEWERKFGDSQIALLNSAKKLVTDSNQVARLAELAAPLAHVVPAGTTEVKFYIAKNAEPNAFALPGGHVIVNTGLLEMVDAPDELLAVIAHEMAHVSEKHVARTLISTAGPLVIFGVFLHSRDGLVNLLGAGSGLMVAQGFSQEYETEADDVGWKYLLAANISPQGMITVFKKLQAYEAGRKGVPEITHAFDSHPALDKRIARLEARWKRLSSKSGFLTLTNSIPKSGRDESRNPFPGSRQP